VTSLDISNSSVDTNGQSYFSGVAIGGHFFDNTESSFYTPDSLYTGFASNGYYYALGVLDNTRRASWAIEGDDDAHALRDPVTRNNQDSMPDGVFIIYSETEVSILDNISLEVWMRFDLSALPDVGSAKIIKAVYSAGIMCIIAQQKDEDNSPGFLITVNFKKDCISLASDSSYFLREHVWNRNSTVSFGSLTDTTGYPFNSTGASIDHSYSSSLLVGEYFPVGHLYDLDLGFIGNQVKALVGGLGFFVGITLEALTINTYYQAPRFKVHTQELALTINTVNFAITDIIQESSGLTSKWTMYDATNNLYDLGVTYGDVLKVTNTADVVTSYFELSSIPSSGLAIHYIDTISESERYESFSKDLPGWKNDPASEDFLDNATSIQNQNNYTVLRPVPYVRVLDDGSYVVASSFNGVFHTSSSAILDYANVNTKTSLYTVSKSAIPRFSTKNLKDFVGFAVNLEEVCVLFTDEMYSTSMDNIDSAIPLTSLLTLTNATQALASSANLSRFGNGLVYDPASGNLFTGGIKTSDNYSYLIEVSTSGVILSCNEFKTDTVGDAEIPIIMDGYSNPLGTEV